MMIAGKATKKNNDRESIEDSETAGYVSSRPQKEVLQNTSEQDADTKMMEKQNKNSELQNNKNNEIKNTNPEQARQDKTRQDKRPVSK